MPNHQPTTTHLVEVVLGGIANWVSNLRSILGLHSQLGQCGPDDVTRVVSDLGLTPSALSERCKVIRFGTTGN